MEFLGVLAWIMVAANVILITGATIRYIRVTLTERRADRESGRAAWLRANHR